VAAWLQLAELAASEIETANFNGRVFERSLREIRKLTVETPKTFELKLKDLCAKSGVAFVLVPELPKCCRCVDT
jgi:HTH-type transcriptional regulator/antitoxin HigA